MKLYPCWPYLVLKQLCCADDPNDILTKLEAAMRNTSRDLWVDEAILPDHKVHSTFTSSSTWCLPCLTCISSTVSPPPSSTWCLPCLSCLSSTAPDLWALLSYSLEDFCLHPVIRSQPGHSLVFRISRDSVRRLRCYLLPSSYKL